MGIFNFFKSKKALTEPVSLLKQAQSRAFAASADQRYGAFERREQPANDRDFLETYNRHPWLHAGVNAIARNAAKVPFKLFKLNDPKMEEVTSGQAYDLLKMPNEHMGYYDMIFGTSAYMKLAGDSFLEKDQPLLPTKLWLLEPSNMTPIPSAKTLFAGWQYTVNARTVMFMPEDIIHFRQFNPLSMFYGTSQASPLTNTLTIDFFAMSYEKDFFEKGGNVSLVIKVKKGLTNEEFETIKSRIREQYSGTGKHHKIMVVEDDTNIDKLGADPKSAQLNELREFNLREVLAVLGVPRLLVQDSKDVSFANAREQLKVFWSETMVPHLKLIQDKLNNNLLKPFGMEGEFDLSSVEALREDLEMKAKIGNALVERGVYTINEVRTEIFDKEEVDWGKTGRDILARQDIGAQPQGTFPLLEEKTNRIKAYLANAKALQLDKLLALLENPNGNGNENH